MELLEYCLTSCPVSQIEPIMAGLVRVVSGMIQSSRKYKIVEPLLSDLQLRIAEKCSQVLSMEEGDKKVGTWAQPLSSIVSSLILHRNTWHHIVVSVCIKAILNFTSTEFMTNYYIFMCKGQQSFWKSWKADRILPHPAQKSGRRWSKEEAR